MVRQHDFGKLAYILDDKKKVHLTFSIYCLLMDPAYF
jgi:hypothetical protein